MLFFLKNQGHAPVLAAAVLKEQLVNMSSGWQTVTGDL